GGGHRPFAGRQEAGPGRTYPRLVRRGADPAAGLPETVGRREAETDRTEAEGERTTSQGDVLSSLFTGWQPDCGGREGRHDPTLRRSVRRTQGRVEGSGRLQRLGA